MEAASPLAPALVGEARARRPVRPTARELAVASLTAGSFAVAGSALALSSTWQTPSPAAVVLLVGAFAVLSRFELEIASGSALPTQLAFVPMLFVLPPAVVPLAVCSGLLLNHAVDVAKGNVHALRALSVAGAAWFSVPPALVVSLAGRPVGWSHWPLYLGALAAQFAGDLVHSTAHERFAHWIPPRKLLRPLGLVYSFDALLSPVALLAVPGLRSGTYAFAALLPLVAVFAALARERRVRFDAEVEATGLELLAHHDPLTSLGNRRKLMADLDAAASGELGPCLLGIFDLDGFKQFNDRFGHPEGDALLMRRSAALAAVSGSAYRLGGDEFCVLVPEPYDTDDFLAACADALGEAGADYRLDTSYGSAFVPREAGGASQALRLADQRLYRKKTARRGSTSETEDGSHAQVG